MAVLANILLVSTVLSSVAAVSVTAGSKFVRRELDNVDLSPTDAQQIKEQTAAKAGTGTWISSDMQFMLMAEGVDECSCAEAGCEQPQVILTDTWCDEAVTKLGHPKGFEWNDHAENPLPVVSGCLFNATTSTIHYNPTATNNSGMTLKGQKICMRKLYTNGTKDVSDPTTACVGGSTPVETFVDCKAACEATGASKEQRFLDDSAADTTTYETAERPKGCYKNAIGNFGFNNAATAPAGTVNGTSVCLNVVPA